MAFTLSILRDSTGWRMLLLFLLTSSAGGAAVPDESPNTRANWNDICLLHVMIIFQLYHDQS